MKLDRNINPGGRGKYALINRRKLGNTQNQHVDNMAGMEACTVEVNAMAVETGSEDQFFVIKYKDKFAGPALRAYVKAIEDEIDRIIIDSGVEFHRNDEAKSLREFAQEITREAEIAERIAKATSGGTIPT